WIVGAVALALAGLALWRTNTVVDLPVDSLSQRAREIAYGGSAAGIVAASALMMAIILATVHRIVPRRPAPRTPAVATSARMSP
ncbi:MAG TPA: hypothetical protein VGF84_17575, partial [Micromonosporaceae bacterium]